MPGAWGRWNEEGMNCPKSPPGYIPQNTNVGTIGGGGGVDRVESLYLVMNGKRTNKSTGIFFKHGRLKL